MKKFRFRFETVLKHRTVTEELRLQELARVQAELDACDRRIESCRAEFDRMLTGRPVNIDIDDFPRREQYLDTLRARIAQEERMREGIAARLDDARSAAVSARQARQAIELIRDADLEGHRRETALAEQNAADEMATQRFQRAGAGGVRS